MKKLLLVVILMCFAIPASASPKGGTTSASGALSPDERKEYYVVLEGGDMWTLFARGFGEGDLDCAIFDEDGNAVGSDTDATNTCLIMGTPSWTGKFLVRLANHGERTIAYNLKIY